MKTVQLIVPCFNEQESLPLLYAELTKVFSSCSKFDFSIIFVNDGSSDNTLSYIQDLATQDEKVKFISFSRNFGKESAMLAGMSYADADFIGIIDADLQHSPKLIPEMLNALEYEDYDIAAARRVDRTGESKVKSAFSKSFYRIINKLSDVKIADGAQDYRIMKQKVVKAILNMPEYNRFSKGIFSWVGFKTKWFEHENIERVAGKTKWSFVKLFSYATDGIISFSTVPLKISFIVGSFTSLFGMVYALYTIIKTLIFGADSPGYPSLFSAVLILGGLILLSLGIIGEYLSRIYLEVKGRPNFVIDETNIVK